MKGVSANVDHVLLGMPSLESCPVLSLEEILATLFSHLAWQFPVRTGQMLLLVLLSLFETFPHQQTKPNTPTTNKINHKSNPTTPKWVWSEFWIILRYESSVSGIFLLPS